VNICEWGRSADFIEDGKPPYSITRPWAEMDTNLLRLLECSPQKYDATSFLLGCLGEMQPQNEDKHVRLHVKIQVILASAADAIAIGQRNSPH
jgi:hypothetical protein